jgi:hypothetical protein
MEISCLAMVILQVSIIDLYLILVNALAGFGYHGDFLNGWDVDVLQQAIAACTNSSRRIEDCLIFNLQLG